MNSNGIFEGKTSCLLTHCARKDLFRPAFFVFVKKIGITSDDKGWTLQLSDTAEVLSFLDADCLLQAKGAENREEGRGVCRLEILDFLLVTLKRSPTD